MSSKYSISGFKLSIEAGAKLDLAYSCRLIVCIHPIAIIARPKIEGFILFIAWDLSIILHYLSTRWLIKVRFSSIGQLIIRLFEVKSNKHLIFSTLGQSDTFLSSFLVNSDTTNLAKDPR